MEKEWWVALETSSFEEAKKEAYYQRYWFKRYYRIRKATNY